MAGLDTPVHPSTVGSERYDACQKAVRKPGYYARDREYLPDGRWHDVLVWVEDRHSQGCRYDLSLADPKCEGCSQRGDGVAYDKHVRANGT